MSNTVFILGAGASKEACAPLMNEFLDVSENLLKAGDLGAAQISFKNVFDAIGNLQLVHSKAQLDIQNIESIFAAFEMAKTLDSFPGQSPDNIDNLIKSLKIVIVETLQRTIRLEKSKGSVKPPETYARFTDMLVHLKGSAIPNHSVSVITFNYDMALDYALHFHRINYDYSIEESNKDDAIPILKLHGSLNWAHCSQCDKVIPVNLKDYFNKGNISFDIPQIKDAILDIGTKLDKFEHCGLNLDKEPVLVPPTWHKEDYYRTISNVWRRAASELSEAENIFVIGYSLPKSDAFFRYLYALGTVSQTLLKRFWVFNPDDSGEVKSRFEDLLGPGAKARFRYFTEKFSTAISLIKNGFPGESKIQS
jgi:NAD-dependent SIR2 family protein deacetylase